MDDLFTSVYYLSVLIGGERVERYFSYMEGEVRGLILVLFYRIAVFGAKI